MKVAVGTDEGNACLIARKYKRLYRKEKGVLFTKWSTGNGDKEVYGALSVMVCR